MSLYEIEESQEIINAEVEKIVNTIFDNRNNDSFYHKGVFNTKDLPNHNNYHYYPNNDPHFRNVIFEKLDDIKNNHCLYWFELESNQKASELKFLLDDYRRNGIKKVPAPNTYDYDKILYLGVRQGSKRENIKLTNITGRINQHLGYYKIGTTQGLQLYEYAKGKDFDITIKIIEFDGIEPYLLNVIEKLLARKMKPFCGQHK